MIVQLRAVRHAVAAANVGSAIKFFDFFLYGLLGALRVLELHWAVHIPVEISAPCFAAFGSVDLVELPPDRPDEPAPSRDLHAARVGVRWIASATSVMADFHSGVTSQITQRSTESPLLQPNFVSHELLRWVIARRAVASR